MHYGRDMIHLGGNNLGFLDGHAAWISSEQIIDMAYEGDLDGLRTNQCPAAGIDWYTANFGALLPGMVFTH